MQTVYGSGSSEFQKIVNDPSNDDYVYYGEGETSSLPLNERFHRLYGYHDGNTPPNEGESRAITNKPDTEGLITPSIVEQNNSYFQYEVDLNPADFSALSIGSPGTFIVDEVPGNNQQDRWYQIRVPLQDFVRKVGNIENFQNISYIRVWLSGYEKPFTLRFATFELVGSQWRNAESVDEQQTTTAPFSISSVNIEENSRRVPIPYRQPEGAIRATDRSRQRQTVANEQSIVLDVEDLGPDEIRMVKRVYPGGLNMVNYSNVRMFVHGEGFDNRGDAELVLRFGTDLVNNYYEYRQPVSPTDPDYPFANKPVDELTDAEREMEAEQVWLYDENSVNILLRAFNQLKQLRDQQVTDPSQVFERGDILDEAPEGTVIGIKGNPSLDRIGEIGMGIKNPYDPANPGQGVQSLDAELWLNELRVSGFDNQKGWAANGKAELKLADFATVNANVAKQTDGFGALNSRLGQRSQADIFSYDLNTSVNLHKFLPARYGWNIPVSLSARQSTSTPRFLPNQGDVRLSEFKDAVNARNDLDEGEKDQLISQRIHESQTFSESYSVNISNVSKQFSQTGLAKYTLDQTTLNFVYNTTDRRSPEYLFRDNWNYNSSIRYNMNFRNTQLFRPFGFLEEVPVLKAVSGLKLGYTPASLNASFGINREYDERRRRSFNNQSLSSLQQSHTFTYNTNFGFGYNLTPSIKTTFQSRSVFDLSRSGVEQNGQPGTVDSTRFRVIPTFKVFEGVITDTLSSRRSNYSESYTAGWQPNLRKIDAVSWVNYSANYNGGYQWRNSPFGSQLGANLSNNFSLNQSLNFGFNELFNRMEWYRNLTNPRNETEQEAPSDTSSAGYSQEDLGEDISGLGRGILRALLSIQSFDISFGISKNSLQSGYAGGPQFFDAFNQSDDTYSPPFSYRTGVTDHIGFGQLIKNPNDNSTLQLPSNKSFSDDLTISSRFRPFENFSIDLTWNTQWDVTRSRSTTIEPDQSRTKVTTQTGNISSSVWAFGKGYESLFRSQLATAFDDINTQNDTLSDALGNNDGKSVLGKNSLQNDFRSAYLGVATGAIGKRNFTPFPMPGWKITWTGLEEMIPIIGQFMSRASINHSYNGIYRLGYNFNSDPSSFPPLNLGSYTVANNRPEYEANSINIEKRFMPLIGFNITWASNLRTNIQYELSKLSSLALSNTTITERISKGLRVSFSYTIRDFKLPFFPRIENALDITLNAGYIEDTEQKYTLDSDLDNALQQPPSTIIQDPSIYDFSKSFTGGQSRINASSIIGYQFSQTIKANFEYTYSKLIPKSTGVFPRTDHDLRFNVVVSIRSN
ncbi:MAG: cell surface protein SprA [Balneolaceae bacterium]|nr:cell surface protein SprA [Balneolaceae bacterium]